MLGLAAQKFVSDIAKDAYAFARTRTAAGPGRTVGAGNAQGASGKNKVSAAVLPLASSGTALISHFAQDRSKTVLTMEDLSAALHEYGVDASRSVQTSS